MKLLLPAHATLFGVIVCASAVAQKTDTPEEAFRAPVQLHPATPVVTWKSHDDLSEQATRGEPEACFVLGMKYLTGEGVPHEPLHAATLFERAAKRGQAEAAFQLGKLYSTSAHVPADTVLAVEYYTLAARAGISEAHYNLGTMLVSGRGVKRDYVEGLAWLIVATKHGAPAEGEFQVRERLKKFPDRIIAAEMRAAALLKNLSNAVVISEVLAPQTPRPPAPNVAVPDKPTPATILLEKPEILPPNSGTRLMMELPGPTAPSLPAPAKH